MTDSPRVRILDKSREFATVHGERSPSDPHAAVHFYQDGLPLDAQGYLVANAPDLQGDSPEATKLRELAERKLKKASKTHAADAAEGTGALAAEGDHEADNEPQDVNLEAWARGEQKVIWTEVSHAIARRSHKRMNSKKDALEFLISEKVVAFHDLSPEHQKLLKD